MCDKYGLGVIATGYTKNAPYVYWSASEETFGKWSLITNDTYNYTHPSLWGDNLIDEPTAAVFPYISKACNSYYYNVNGKLPFVNLFPIYANDEQLGNTCTLDETAASVFWRHDDMNERINSYKQHVSDYINTIDTDYICVDIYPLDRQVKKDGTVTLSPVLIGAFTEKDGDGKAYSVVNMWEPNTKLNAPVKLTFPGAEEITYYRKGVKTTVTGDILNITLETGEGIFVTVK